MACCSFNFKCPKLCNPNRGKSKTPPPLEPQALGDEQQPGKQQSITTEVKRRQRANLQTGLDVAEDVRRLYRCYLFDDHPELRDLVVRLNVIFDQNRDGPYNDVFLEISCFALRIADLYDTDPLVAKAANEDYKRLMDQLCEDLTGGPSVEKVLEKVRGDNVTVKDRYGLSAQENASHVKRLLTHIWDVVDPFCTLLELAEVAATFAPVPYLKDAIKATLFLINCAQRTQTNYYGVNQLASTVGECILMIDLECSMEGSDTLTKNEDNIKRLVSKLKDIGLRCEKLSRNNPLSEFFQSGKRANEVRQLKDEVKNAFNVFYTRAQISQLQKLNEISKKIDMIYVEFDTLQLQRLPKLDGLETKDCLPGSRDGEVGNVERWLSSNGEFAYWINGTAGVGKSILARHLADLLKDGDRLGCLVHLSANSQHSPLSLIQGMARELTVLHQSLYETIVNEAKQEISNMETIDSIFKRYLYEPIKQLKAPAPVVFIIDALDEWRPQHVESFLNALNNTHGDCIRFIFTSRTHDEITNALGHLSHCSFTLLKVPGNVMESYFRGRFSSMHPRLDVRPDEIDSLVKQAQGLFIWAATVCRLVETVKAEARQDALKEIIASPREATNPHSDIWDLYNKGLMRLCRERIHDPGILCNMLCIMATMQRDLSVKSFSIFAHVKESDVQFFHERLQAFYASDANVQWKADTIYPLQQTTHSSFRDFIFAEDINSRQAHGFAIKYKDGHSTFSRVCAEYLGAPFQTSEDSLDAGYVVTYWMVHCLSGKESLTELDMDDVLGRHLQIVRSLSLSTNPKELSPTPFFSSFIKSHNKTVVTFLNTTLKNINEQQLPITASDPFRVDVFINTLFQSLDALEFRGALPQFLNKARILFYVVKHILLSAQLIRPWMEQGAHFNDVLFGSTWSPTPASVTFSLQTAWEFTLDHSDSKDTGKPKLHTYTTDYFFEGSFNVESSDLSHVGKDGTVIRYLGVVAPGSTVPDATTI